MALAFRHTSICCAQVDAPLVPLFHSEALGLAPCVFSSRTHPYSRTCWSARDVFCRSADRMVRGFLSRYQRHLAARRFGSAFSLAASGRLTFWPSALRCGALEVVVSLWHDQVGRPRAEAPAVCAAASLVASRGLRLEQSLVCGRGS